MMATSQSSTEQTSVIRLDIDGEKYRLAFAQSSSAAKLRKKISERHQISTNTCFLDADDCRVHIEDEESITVKELLTEKNFIRLITVKNKLTPIPIPEMSSKVFERKTDLNYIQTLSQSSTKTSSRELKLPSSTSTHLENKTSLATHLDLDMWQKIFHNCNLLRGIKMHEAIPERAFKYIFKFKECNDNLSWWQVTDDSYSRVYLKDKEMHSSFLSSQFFDVGIETSTPFIGFGINAEYSKRKSTTNTQIKIYLTYCFNFPRVTLELDSSYLEPTSQFIEAIDNVLSISSQDEQIIKLEEVLSTYGHVYPRKVVLGGQLYHTEIHDNEENAEEAKKRINAKAPLPASVIKAAKISAGAGADNRSQNKSSEQTSLLTFEAVGGDTRYNRDPTRWTDTVANPSLWRIIEQDNYQSVITILDQERQEKLEKIIKYYKTIKSSSLIKNNSTWKQHGITIAGRHEQRYQLNPLYFPYGIYVDGDNESIYIADCYNHRIVKCKCDGKNKEVVAGGNGKGNRMDQLNHPTDVIVDKKNNSLIICDKGNKRVIRWSLQNNQNQQIIISDINCCHLTMDQNGDLYVSDCAKDEVRRWRIGDNEGTIVAGGNGQGNNLNQLSLPTFIFVDEDYSVYVSDVDNHRVMKWMKGAKEGIVVAGGQGQGKSLTQLSNPNGVIVDHLGNVYVADSGNDRIMRWLKGSKHGSIIVGGNGIGNKSNQFDDPIGLSFDREGNLYVDEYWNHRVVKFVLN